MRLKYWVISVVLMFAVGQAAVFAAEGEKAKECEGGSCPLTKKAADGESKTACGAESCPKGKEECDAKACPEGGKDKCDKDCEACGTAECPKVMATVNGDAITVAELDEQLEPQFAQYEQMGREVTDRIRNMMRFRAAQGNITEKLIAEQVEEEGIKVTEKDIDAKIAELAGQNNMTVEEFLKAQEERAGVSEKEFRKRAKLGTGFEKLMEKVSAKEDLGVSEEKAKEVYMNQPVQVQASHILIDTREKDEAAKAEAKKEIEAILGDVKDGGDFAEIAKEKSDCPSGQRGGDLGFFTKEKMVPAFSNAAFAMEVGEVSDVVETQFGYHIIKVTDRKAPDASKFDEQKEQIMVQEEQKNKSQFAQTYIQKLAENAEIEWNEEYDPRQQMPQQPAAAGQQRQ